MSNVLLNHVNSMKSMHLVDMLRKRYKIWKTKPKLRETIIRNIICNNSYRAYYFF